MALTALCARLANAGNSTTFHTHNLPSNWGLTRKKQCKLCEHYKIFNNSQFRNLTLIKIRHKPNNRFEVYDDTLPNRNTSDGKIYGN